MDFNLARLKELRKDKRITIASLAQIMGTSSTQVHRLENGKRRLTVEALLNYCRALNIQPAQLFSAFTMVPVTGIVDDVNNVVPLGQDDSVFLPVASITSDMHNTAALLWQPTGRISTLHGHVLFYYAHKDGISESAWGERSLIRLADGTQLIGWPIRGQGAYHIDNHESRTAFNVDITWAAPILAVIPPFLIRQWQQEYDRLMQ